MAVQKPVSVDLVSDSDDPDVVETFERSLTKGGVANIHRTVANSPKVFKAFIGMSDSLRYRTDLDPVERELAILCVLERHQGVYELTPHRLFAKALGATDEQIANVRTGKSDVYTERQKQILLFAEHFAADPSERNKLPPHNVEAWLDNRQRIELGMNLVMYMGLAHFTALFDVPEEDFSKGGFSLENAKNPE